MAIEVPLVYTVILNWNLKRDILECVASVLRSRFSNYRVLVVDNGSTDGSPEAVKSRFSDVEVILNESNLGFAAGNNVGIKQALQRGADYVLLLNNDTIADPGMMVHLVEASEADPQVGIAAPKILYYHDKNRIWSLGSKAYKYLPVPLCLGRDKPDRGDFTQPLEVDYVTGCAMLVKRQVFESIGLFDPRYFMYYEDADFCCRAREASYKIICIPQAKIWHKASVSARKVAPRMAYYQARNRIWFYCQHPHGPCPWLSSVYVVFSELLKVLQAWRQGGGDAAIFRLRGLRDGLWKKSIA